MLRTRMFSLRSGDLRTQATNAAHDQIDLHPRARSLIKFLDDLLIDQRIQLRDDARRFACPRVVALALDELR